MSSLPMILKILILMTSMLGAPLLAGGIFGKRDVPGMWVSGRFALWALFLVISVPCILKGKEFPLVVGGYGAAAAAVCGAGGFRLWRLKHGKNTADIERMDPENHRDMQGSKAFWIIFGLLLAFQLVQAVQMTYGDGDDAYYVAVSGITENSDTMYQKLPYTGGTTDVDIRHGLAPFPIWIAFLSRLSGVKSVSVAHVAVPLVLIPMTYLIFYLIAGKLFAGNERRIPLFLIFTELLILFGDYSFYTVENFMLARSRQGKAALGSIVIPMLFYLLFVLADRLEKKMKCDGWYWLLFVCVMAAGCLCTTMGAMLVCLLTAVAGVCMAILYRNWKVLVPLALCCIPCVACALIYVIN